MGKVKEQLLDNGLYTEDTSVEQVINVGDTVVVYDSKLQEPSLATVLYSKQVAEDIVLSVELKAGGLMQVYEIQCRKAKRQLPRALWLRYDKATKLYEVRSGPQDGEGWFKVKEEVGS